MKTKRNFTIVLAVLLAIAVISTTAWAKRPTDPAPTCPAGLAGTWAGGAGSDIRWFATHTSDSLDPTKGEMIMNWTYINPSFIGPEFTLTPGHGVWQLNADGNYDYTWYAYALLRTDGSIAGTVRVSGVAILQDFSVPPVTNCDMARIYYNFDMANGEVLPTDFDTVTFDGGPHGWATEVRVPLTVTPLP